MISAIIITSNEEDVLEQCLRSLQGFADEIIIVDSNSKDKTVGIAKKYKAHVVEHKLESFAEQRNIGKDYAKGEWIFYIDSDERLTDEFKEEAKLEMASFDPGSNVGGFYVRRKTFYLGKDWGFADRVQRLFYKEKLRDWFGVVHETPQIAGEFGSISAPILHYTHRNLEHMVEKTNKWSDYEADLRIKADHPRMSWWRFPRVMITSFLRSYLKEGGYKNGTPGLIESLFQAFSAFITYAKLWELQNKR
ncbi:MAG: glycosyltransferase family 2 protein [Candidatus Levyibacteriota bacterium]